MESLQQKCRPKHQVLVLKCYPRTTKGAVDVKPNSSELSYLLFYALSRRSKIQKIGSFLEKKTAKDVWRLRIGNVQVTLQILTALIEKSAKDVALIAPCVLHILDTILRSKDLTMVESSIPTFEAFCQNHDASSLFADQEYLRQYEAVVRSYAALASTSHAVFKALAATVSPPIALRWRIVGLQAIMALVSSDALASVAGRQLNVVVPVVLENLWTDGSSDLVDVLRCRLELESKAEVERSHRGRTSFATERTADDAPGDPNPIALSGTAFDVDKLAEEDIGVLAMRCLKQVFVVPNRPQILTATVALLRFVEGMVGESQKGDGWAVRVLEMAARWTPVQDRYVILVTTMDRLSKTPVQDDSLPRNLVLVSMVGSLLRSDINLIGLSVMDVLLTLLTHTKRTIQLPGGIEVDDTGRGETVAKPRKELLSQLQRCVGDLATHVYYADQISDMISAILLKLKPGRPSSNVSTPHGEKADGGASGAVDAPEGVSSVDAYFAQSLGKVSALRAIKAILLVANPEGRVAGNLDLSRSRVPIQVWEGTQWLLRDPDGAVRKAYGEALLAWLDRETTDADFKAVDDSRSHRATARTNRDLHPAAPARRAVSSASAGNRERGHHLPKVARSHFLPLLHLAVYDNALQYCDYEADFVLLHALLSHLVLRLGVNAVRFGLPMIFRLQEDIPDADATAHRIRLGSLCHGYLWAITDRFDVGNTPVGVAIQTEISRRRSKSAWVDGISVPAPALEAAHTPGSRGSEHAKTPGQRGAESETLQQFDDKASLVESVAAGYQAVEDGASPPASPLASPNRSMSVPVLGGTMALPPLPNPDKSLPSHFREQMLAGWTRESTIASVQEGSRSESLNGSRSGTTATANAATRNRLGITAGLNGSAYGLHPSPYGGSQPNLNPASMQVLGMAKVRQGSVRSGLSPSPWPSEASRPGVASVEQLKMVLAGQATAPPLGSMSAASAAGRDDDSGDSLVSYDSVRSEMSTMASQQPDTAVTATPKSRTRSVSRERKNSSPGPLTSHPALDSDLEDHHDGPSPRDSVPPVPPLPALSSLAGKTAALRLATHDLAISTQDHARSAPPLAGAPPISAAARVATPVRGSVRSRAGGSPPSPRTAATKTRDDSGIMDLQELLRGISGRTTGSESVGSSIVHVTKPPY